MVRHLNTLAGDPLISWSKRKLIELTDGRIYDCCEFELLAEPSGFGASSALYGAMGWPLEPALTLEDYQVCEEELELFYSQPVPSVVVYAPTKARQLRPYATSLEMSFIGMIHQRRSGLAQENDIYG